MDFLRRALPGLLSVITLWAVVACAPAPEPEASTPSAAHAHEDAHHHAHASGTLSLDKDGQRWATDAALREGMQRIHDAAAAALPEHDHLGADAMASAALAQEVDDAVAYLFANCRLEPEADANLHLLLAQMIGASAALRRDDESGEGLLRLLAALDAYPRHFDHPGWEPLATHP